MGVILRGKDSQKKYNQSITHQDPLKSMIWENLFKASIRVEGFYRICIRALDRHTIVWASVLRKARTTGEYACPMDLEYGENEYFRRNM